MKILIIEDNFKLRENLTKFFKLSGILAEEAANGQEALGKVHSGNYDCIILDINMPYMNGKEFLKNIRSESISVPVIALTSNSMLQDKMEVFDLGADDYLTKPFELQELLVRIKALTRRQQEIVHDILKVRDIEVNLTHHKVFHDKKEVALTNKEFMIIEYLMRNKGIPKSKTEILEHVWGEQEESLDYGSVTLEAHISFIRKKLAKDFIKTIKGVGYVIE